ncbi:MAG: SRPBCC family protein [Myxococcota bacterium]
MSAAGPCYHRGLDIDPEIGQAERLPAALHHDPTWFERMRERVLVRTWHAYPGPLPPLEPGLVMPWNLLPVSIDEPLVLCVGEQGPRLLSNVCTHCGAMLVARVSTNAEGLRCSAHGRSFALNGLFDEDPAFEGVDGVPSAKDHLASVALERWGPMAWASLDPVHPFAELVEPLQRRLSFLDIDTLRPVAKLFREYHVPAGWLAVCEQKLRGAAADEVHPSPWGSLRLEMASGEQARLTLPPEHPDHGRDLASLHSWLFPSTSIAVYPWGLAIELILPLTPTETRVVCMGLAADPDAIDDALGTTLDQRAHEAHGRAVSVARGQRARLYPRSGYSPRHERALHHFHRQLGELLADSD